MSTLSPLAQKLLQNGTFTTEEAENEIKLDAEPFVPLPGDVQILRLYKGQAIYAKQILQNILFSFPLRVPYFRNAVVGLPGFIFDLLIRGKEDELRETISRAFNSSSLKLVSLSVRRTGEEEFEIELTVRPPQKTATDVVLMLRVNTSEKKVEIVQTG